MAKSKCPDNMIIIPLDVTSDCSIDNCFERVSKDLSSTGYQLWALVNNAGIARYGPLEWGSYQWAIEEIINVNLIGVIKMSRKFLPLIRRSKGRMIFIASGAGRLATPALSTYCITKSAVIALARGLYLDLKESGVNVVSIEPSFGQTQMTSREGLTSITKRAISETPKEVAAGYNKNYYAKPSLSYHATHLRFLQASSVPERVIETICKSVSIKKPQFQYLVAPFIARTMLYALSSLPDEVSMSLVKIFEKSVRNDNCRLCEEFEEGFQTKST